jgi:MFS family permease
LALLGYGVPGMILGISIGKAADKYGRKKLIPIGLAFGAVSVFLLAFKLSLFMAALAITVLSMGYDMTQPLFAGMVTTLVDQSKRGQAVGLSSCMLFVGYGVGALIFHWFMTWGMNAALIAFSIIETLLFFSSRKLFKYQWK